VALHLASDIQGSGPPLVVLHGLFGSRANWRSVARALSATHTVVSVDLRNHGASPWADEMDYPSMADDVRRLIEGLGLERPALLGHSMGGKTAMALALMHPQQVDRLIVVDIAPVPYADTLTPFVDAMRSIDLAAAASRADVQQRLRQRVPDPGVASFLAHNLVAHGDRLEWRLNLAGIGAAIPRLCAFPSGLMDRCFRRQTTVIAGGRSDYVAPRDGSSFQPMFPLADVGVVENAGHWVHADQPAAFIGCVRQALGPPGCARTIEPTL
jgi:esterase